VTLNDLERPNGHCFVLFDFTEFGSFGANYVRLVVAQRTLFLAMYDSCMIYGHRKTLQRISPENWPTPWHLFTIWLVQHCAAISATAELVMSITVVVGCLFLGIRITSELWTYCYKFVEWIQLLLWGCYVCGVCDVQFQGRSGILCSHSSTSPWTTRLSQTFKGSLFWSLMPSKTRMRNNEASEELFCWVSRSVN